MKFTPIWPIAVFGACFSLPGGNIRSIARIAIAELVAIYAARIGRADSNSRFGRYSCLFSTSSAKF